MIYLDHNSTTFLLEGVKEILLSEEYSPYNPSSIHSYGRNARKILEESRAILAEALNIKLGRDNYKIIFTSGATESNNLILENFADKTVIYSAIEHPSIIEKVAKNTKAKKLGVDSNGIVNLAELEDLLENSPSPTLVSIMAANNETGIIQPLYEASKIVKKYGSLLHVDATQILGKARFDIIENDIDFISISSHKIGGLAGIGALISKDNFHIKPIILGGGQERSERSGTENVIGAKSLAYAASYSTKTLEEYIKHTSYLRNIVEENILNYKKAHIIGQNSPRLPNTSLIAMESVSSNVQLIQFDSELIAVSNGSACSSGKVRESHVLKSMGYGKEISSSIIRVSFGRNNTENDAISFIKSWEKIYNKFN